MTRRSIAVLLAIAAVAVLLPAGQFAQAAAPDADETIAGRPAETMPDVHIPPAYYGGISGGAVYTGAPARAYRRSALPAVSVYIGPRAVYPGIMAPWGSIPPHFYAASYPLPYMIPPFLGYPPYPPSRWATPFGTDSALTQPPPLPGIRPDEAPHSPFTPEAAAPPSPGPEAIPAPQPMDQPSAGGVSRSAEGAEPAPSRQAPQRPAAIPGPMRRWETGPREF